MALIVYTETTKLRLLLIFNLDFVLLLLICRECTKAEPDWQWEKNSQILQ